MSGATTAAPGGGFVARVLALLLVVVAGWLIFGPMRDFGRARERAIWLEPGRYQGPADATLDPAQVEAVVERARNLNY